MGKHIVIYNWVQFDDQFMRGGGVSVYLKNIIPELISKNYKVTFISSGQHFSLFKRSPHIKETKNIYSEHGVRSYRVINSSIKAPAHDAFYQVDDCLNSPPITDLLINFLNQLGDVDEFHLHNIEGIATNLVEEVSKKTNIKTNVWLHNYHWVCPQIDLFRDSKYKCEDNQSGLACVGCLGHDKDMAFLKKAQILGSFLELNRLSGTMVGNLLYAVAKNGFPILKATKEALTSLFTQQAKHKDLGNLSVQDRIQLETTAVRQQYYEQGASYKRWREVNVFRLNNYVETVFAVSQIVKDRVVKLGVCESKIVVAPLGMDVYKKPEVLKEVVKTDWNGEKLRLAFMGYPIPSKGLPFLCDALQSLDKRYKDKLELIVVSNTDKVMQRKIVRLMADIEVKFLHGYDRSQIQEISQIMDLLVVPPIWWETFNQVTYEMIMHGVPVLISDSVGISSFAPEEFKFESSSQISLNSRLAKIIDRELRLEDFWQPCVFELCSVEKHVQEYLLK